MIKQPSRNIYDASLSLLVGFAAPAVVVATAGGGLSGSGYR